MSTPINCNSDIRGTNIFAPDPSTDKYSATLTNGSVTTVTVPSNYDNWIASFSYQPGTNVWVAYDQTAAIPAGATLVATTSELNPSQRRLKKGTVISVVTDDTTADFGIVFYALT